jgi:hypothetical protein
MVKREAQGEKGVLILRFTLYPFPASRLTRENIRRLIIEAY